MPDKILVRNLHAGFGTHEVLRGVTVPVATNEVLSIIGPAHSGKTTLLRIINRMIEGEPGFTRSGEVLLDGTEVGRLDPDALRRRIGLIFATPIPLPGTIFDNIAYGPRLHRLPRRRVPEVVESSLRAAFLWDEVKDRLQTSALRLSGG
ncbi:ATP-binding cassette domain-containing protein, partial [candidate division WOR-3 bacterium]|nr:ATP-binding cassette domain-containing protein [candidate division WOR-3 bacterium]